MKRSDDIIISSAVESVLYLQLKKQSNVDQNTTLIDTLFKMNQVFQICMYMDMCVKVKKVTHFD